MHLQYSTQWDTLAHVGALFDADGDGKAEPYSTTATAAEMIWWVQLTPVMQAPSRGPLARQGHVVGQRRSASKTWR